MFSFVGDSVLDPFLGSGTTSLAARRLGRNSIGYEVNHDFLPTIEEKLGIKQKMLFQDAQFEVLTQAKLPADFAEAINKLPYIFKDPVKFDKKVDPRKVQFGSKINNDSAKRQKYYRVGKVNSRQNGNTPLCSTRPKTASTSKGRS
jgi:site-specific DNA-methyltransferase (adenine-specific)